jgi:hypothetical protein
MILVWMPSGTAWQCHMVKLHVMRLEEQFERLARKQVCKLQESAVTVSLSPLCVMHCWRPQQENNNTWPEVQESRPLTGAQKYTVSFLLKKSMFSHKGLEKSMFNTTHTHTHTHTALERWRVSSGIHYRTCNLWIWLNMVLQLNDSKHMLMLLP